MKENSHYQIIVLPQAQRQLLQIRRPIQNQIRSAIRSLASDPTPPDSIPMTGKGQGLYRLRIGGYRIIYRVHEDRLVVVVIRVGPRGNVYRGFEDKP